MSTKDRDPFLAMKLDLARQVAACKDPSILRFRQAIEEEFGEPPGPGLIEEFKNIVEGGQRRGTAREQDPARAFAMETARNKGATIMQFRRLFEERFGQPPNADLIRCFMENLGNPAAREGGQRENENEAFVVSLARQKTFTVLKFRDAYKSRFGQAPSNAHIELFIKELADSKTRDESPARESRREAAPSRNAQLSCVLKGITQSAVIITLPNGIITDFNTGASQMLGYGPGEVTGRMTPEHFFLNSELKARASALSAEAGTPVSGFETLVFRACRGEYEEKEWTLVKKNGARITARVSFTPTRNENGEISGFVCSAQDITASKCADEEMRRLTAEKEILEYEKMETLERILSNVVMPLNIITGFTELLLELIEDETLQSYALAIKKSAERLCAAINDEVDFEKIADGEIDLNETDFDLAGLANDIAGAAGVRLGQKPVRLSLDISDNLPGLVHGEAARIRQVLSNILDNAVDQTESGEISLGVDAEEEAGRIMVHFMVRDTGRGLTEAQLEKIFKPRPRKTGQAASPSHGPKDLSLFECKHIALMLKGDLWAYGAPGEGSEFHFTVRVDKAAQDANQDRKARILIVDDEPLNLRMMELILSKEGHSVTSVRSGREAISAVEEKSGGFDVVLMDIYMPEMDGAEAARKIRENGRSLPILALTAFGSKADRDRYLAVGMNEVLLKPISKPLVLGAINKWAFSGPAPAA